MSFRQWAKTTERGYCPPPPNLEYHGRDASFRRWQEEFQRELYVTFGIRSCGFSTHTLLEMYKDEWTPEQTALRYGQSLNLVEI